MSNDAPKPSRPSQEPPAALLGLNRLDWQAPLFAETPSRLALMRLGAPAPQGPTLFVYRNHAFEAVASALSPFLAFAGYGFNVLLSDYDDTLSLPDTRYDATLVWLDFDRYPRLRDDDLATWLIARLQVLRDHAGGPLIVANDPGVGPRADTINAALSAWAARTPAGAVLDLRALSRGLGSRAFDLARATATGTRLTDALAILAARALAFEVLAPFAAPPIKALAVDLDNTLYRGVLGEDGVDGVVLTEGHAALQRSLAGLAERGILVCIVSRNEPADVQELFEARRDFPLRPEHVANWQVGWGEKSSGIICAAAALTIAPDSILFIDDNAGELLQVGGSIPGLRLLHAQAEADTTEQILAAYPGIPRAGAGFAGRAADLAANAQRMALAQAATDETAYLEALHAELTFCLDPQEDLSRLAEISRKTNQFNLTLQRLDEVAVDGYLRASDRCVVHVRMSDRLADSGSVAAAFMRREGDVAVVDEFCISCRALGRKLENLMAAEAFRAGQVKIGGASVMIAWKRGPRNQPALDWLAGFTGVAPQGAEGHQLVPADRLQAPATTAVRVRWIDG